jgi:hypothetical protein
VIGQVRRERKVAKFKTPILVENFRPKIGVEV